MNRDKKFAEGGVIANNPRIVVDRDDHDTVIPFSKPDYKQMKINKESVLKFFPKKEIDIPPILDYESPINVIMGQMRMEQEDNIFRAVREYGVDVDKNELIKALQYDREQYEKGYTAGYNKKDSEIVRCKDCKYVYPDERATPNCIWCRIHDTRFAKNGFCSYGERKENER